MFENVLPLIVTTVVAPSLHSAVPVNVSVATPKAGSLNVPLTVTD